MSVRTRNSKSAPEKTAAAAPAPEEATVAAPEETTVAAPEETTVAAPEETTAAADPAPEEAAATPEETTAAAPEETAVVAATRVLSDQAQTYVRELISSYVGVVTEGDHQQAFEALANFKLVYLIATDKGVATKIFHDIDSDNYAAVRDSGIDKNVVVINISEHLSGSKLHDRR